MNNTRSLIEIATKYYHAGCCVIPIRADGSKAPALESWKQFRQCRSTLDELAGWFDSGQSVGVGLLQGRVSGRDENEAGLVVDVDDDSLVEPFKTAVKSAALGLIEKTAWVKSPNGCHFYCRYEVGDQPPIPNVKLAMDVVDGKPKTLIETRGEGGYVIAPGSPPECHPSRVEYRIEPGGADLFNLSQLSRDEAELLLTIARTFDELPPEEPSSFTASNGSGLRPGDDFNERGTWEPILEPHGWTRVGQSGERKLWRRPGKDTPGISATTGSLSKAGNDLFVVFSSNAHPFDSCGPGGRVGASYTRFAAYALLNHGGDFQAATRALADQGYGNTAKPEIDLSGILGNGKEEAATPQQPNRSGSLLRHVAASWTREAEANSAPPRFPTGLPTEIGPGQMMVLGGAPGTGKTTLAQQAVQDALLNDPNLRAVIANCEMRPEDLFCRQLALHSGVDYKHLRNRDDLTPDERKQVAASHEELVDLLGDRLTYVASGSLDLVEKVSQEFGADIVLIDYVQRFRTSERPSDQRAELNRVMERLRDLCFKGPGVIAISALSRGVKNSEGSYDKPNISSFRESSELEYSCDEGYALCRQGSIIEMIPVKLRFRSLEDGRVRLQQDASLRFIPQRADISNIMDCSPDAPFAEGASS